MVAGGRTRRIQGSPLTKFIGTLVGAYATSNGGAGKTESYISRWRYQGKGQDIGNGVTVPYTPFVGA